MTSHEVICSLLSKAWLNYSSISWHSLQNNNCWQLQTYTMHLPIVINFIYVCNLTKSPSNPLMHDFNRKPKERNTKPFNLHIWELHSSSQYQKQEANTCMCNHLIQCCVSHWMCWYYSAATTTCQHSNAMTKWHLIWHTPLKPSGRNLRIQHEKKLGKINKMQQNWLQVRIPRIDRDNNTCINQMRERDR